MIRKLRVLLGLLICFTGLRPGEKLFEELRMEGENMQRTRHEKIHIWRTSACARNSLGAAIGTLIHTAREQDAQQMAELLHQLVPEYSGALARQA